MPIVLIKRLLTVFLIFIELWLSWNKIIWLMLYPCAQILKKMLYGRQSLTPNIFSLVELFVFILWFLELWCSIPYTNEIQPLVCLFRLGCTAYVASTRVYNWLILYIPMILLSSIVCSRYCNTCLSLAVSSSAILATLVHKKQYSRLNVEPSLFCYPKYFFSYRV